jgi:nitroimidazol reductase NimA-like FMN-containing flavoprotein (pyridoxamine 5'-phosphate oxidase superfamily)
VRRTENEIRDRAAIEDIIARAPVCRLALSDNGEPYIVPMNFGYRDGVLYFHGAASGKKIDIIGRNSRVSFEMEVDIAIVESDVPCNWSMRYRCVVGSGTASIVEDPEEKRRAIGIIFAHYARRFAAVPDVKVRRAAVIKVVIDRMTGKQSGY